MRDIKRSPQPQSHNRPTVTTKILINLAPIRPFLRAASPNLQSEIFNPQQKKGPEPLLITSNRPLLDNLLAS
jgi:hypothetical protein